MKLYAMLVFAVLMQSTIANAADTPPPPPTDAVVNYGLLANEENSAARGYSEAAAGHNLSAELATRMNQAQELISNLTAERDALKKTVAALTVERDALKAAKLPASSQTK